MKRLSDNAIEIVNELHTEKLAYRCDCGEQHTWETDNDFCSYGEQ